MGAIPESLVAIAQQVDRRLESILEIEVRRWGELDGDLVDPVSEVLRLVRSGGKRLRPAFCHWGFVAAGGDDGEMADAVVSAGAALELLHAQALFHGGCPGLVSARLSLFDLGFFLRSLQDEPARRGSV